MHNELKILRNITENLSLEVSLIILELNEITPDIDNLAEVIKKLQLWDSEINTLSEKIKSALIFLLSPNEIYPS